MRLGTSGLGVIAVVSLLVTAAPERNESVGNNRESEIKHSRSSIKSVGISRTYYSWPVRVGSVTASIDHSRSSFVSIEHDRRPSSLRPVSSSFPLSSSSSSQTTTALRHNDSNTKTPTELSSFPIDPPVSTRASALGRNFARPSKAPNDLSSGNSFASSKRKSNYNVRSDTSVTVVSPRRNFWENFFVSLNSPISNFITGATMPRSTIRRDSRRDRRGKRETITLDEGMKSRDENDDKVSTTYEKVATKTRTVRSSRDESAITMSHRLTTVTSETNKTVVPLRSSVDVNFRNATERYESRKTRMSPEFSSDKENIGKSRYLNGRDDPIFRSTERTIFIETMDLTSSNYPHSTNYPINQQSNAHFTIPHDSRNGGRANDRKDRDARPFAGSDTRMDELTNYSMNENISSISGSNEGLSRESLVRDLATVRDVVSTPRTLMEITVRKHETLIDSRVSEEIAIARQIAGETLPDVPIIGTGSLTLVGNIGNTSGVDIGLASLDNHKAIKVRSFQTTRAQREKQVNHDQASSLLPSRLPKNLDTKDTAVSVDETSLISGRTEIPNHAINQITFAKSIYPIAKNSTKQSINLLDGRSNKIFYEIKPSLITDMDRSDDADYTTTTRRSFEKFMLPSVPSAFGKFGPYFLDEEDRRNVTERIGNTVQLDCRIGLLGHRKVTWLQHYKDSFRLLTVERESYSVDRRISLNFQYPDNWRLQIAYASMRDSGLYKCQVEIDQDRSLVKRYNVIITAPILTITDDSGRPVSGERHLKAGSALKLRCEARDVIQRLNESVLWMRGDETLGDDVSENRTTEFVNERDITVVISTLLVERATPRHAGNYSCIVPDKARTTIAVHVLNGELPAAVQHGSGVSTAVLNIWLVHLTASYGFFR